MSLTEPVSLIVDRDRSGLLCIHPAWERIELGEVVDVINGFAFPSSSFSKHSGIPLIRIRDVGSTQTDTRFDGPFETRYVVLSGDLIVGMDGDFNCALWGGGQALLNQRVCKLVPNERFIDKKFLLYGLPGYLRAINRETSSVTVKHLSSRSIQEIPFPLPPVAEQRRIVAAIEEQFSRLDAAVASLQRARANLKRYRAAVLQAAFGGHLQRDGRWREVNLSDLLREPLANGRSVPDDANGLPVLRLNALRPDGTVDFSAHKLGRLNDRDFSRFQVHEGDFLVARGNGSLHLVGLGALATAPSSPIAFPDTMIRIRPLTDEVSPRFLAILWRSRLIRQQIEASAKTTAGIYKINQQDLRKIVLHLPPRSDQDRTADEIERAFSVVSVLESTVERSLKRAERLRLAILKRASAGELVPQDPNDEPASELLERIRAERADTNPERSKRNSRGMRSSASR